MDASDAEEFSEVSTKPLRSLPYDSPGQTFVAFEKPDGVPAVGKFSNMLKFIVKEVRYLSPYLCQMHGTLSSPYFYIQTKTPESYIRIASLTMYAVIICHCPFSAI